MENRILQIILKSPETRSLVEQLELDSYNLHKSMFTIFTNQFFTKEEKLDMLLWGNY